MPSSEATAGGDIDVAATLRRLRAGWKIIVGAVVLAVAAAILYLNVTTYKYAVEMRVAPVNGGGGDGLSGRLSQYGGLAAAAGVALPDSGGSTSIKFFVEALHSRDIADILARDPRLLHRVFYREWDASAHRWRSPSGGFHDFVQTTKSLIGLPLLPWQPPGGARLQAWMQEQIAIDQNIKTPVVTVTMASSDPALAIDFLTRLSTTVDELLRQRSLLRTDDYIRYLAQRLPTISLAEQRVAVAQALGEQERLKMVASSGRPFAAEIFEHPASSERPVTPNPAKTLIIATVLGLFAGVAITLVRRRRPIAVIEP